MELIEEYESEQGRHKMPPPGWFGPERIGTRIGWRVVVVAALLLAAVAVGVSWSVVS